MIWYVYDLDSREELKSVPIPGGFEISSPTALYTTITADNCSLIQLKLI